jgi:serine/threonine-protein kinase RsbW
VSAFTALELRRIGAAGTAFHTELRLDVPSDVAFVGPAVELISAQCHTGVLSRRRVRFNLRTALAEALTNAILYGNGADPAKWVRVRVELGRQAVRIHVEDDGRGFDAAAVPDPTAPERLLCEDGRGLFVMRHLVDHVAFNARGNAVCLTLMAG